MTNETNKGTTTKEEQPESTSSDMTTRSAQLFVDTVVRDILQTRPPPPHMYAESAFPSTPSSSRAFPSELSTTTLGVDWDTFLAAWQRFSGTIAKQTTASNERGPSSAVVWTVLDTVYGLSLLHHLCLAECPPDIFANLVGDPIIWEGTQAEQQQQQQQPSQHIPQTVYTIPRGDLATTPLHLACAAACHPRVVHYLVQAAPRVLHQTDVLGRLPLHWAVLMAGRSYDTEGTTAGVPSSPTVNDEEEVIQILLQPQLHPETVNGSREEDDDPASLILTAVDSEGHTPLSLAVGRSSPRVVALLLQACTDPPQALPTEPSGKKEEDLSTSRKKVDVQQHLRKGLPLHKALKSQRHLGRGRSAGHVVQLLVQKDPHLLSTQDQRGQSAWHVALSEGVDSMETFRALLLLQNGDNAIFFTKDVLGQTPLDVFVQRIVRQPQMSLSMVKALVRADSDRLFWSVVNDKGESLLDRYIRHLVRRGEGNGDASVISKEILYQVLLAMPPGTGYYGLSVTACQEILRRTRYEKFLSDSEWHHTMNMVMSKRLFTFYFMLDLYVRILMVVMFSIGSHDRLGGDNSYDTWWAFLITYMCAAYLLLWQVKLIIRYELYYIRDVWSVLDVTTLVLVIISASLLHSNPSISSFRSFHVLVGGMLWFITLTVALRSTFLPFAVFVSGLIKILQYMIPFGTTTFLILGAFAEMFYKSMIQRPECQEPVVEAEFCQFDNAFLAVYNMFLSGIDPSLLSIDTESHLLWLSISFQITFSIVMLNVLVAVVFDAWGDVSPQGRIVFGLHRHRFLMEVTEKGWFCFTNPSLGTTTKWLIAVDKHVCSVLGRFNARPLAAYQSKSLTFKVIESIQYLLEGCYLLLWFLLGLVSAGVLWAKPFREFIFSIRHVDDDVSEEEERDQENAQTLENTRNYIKYLEREMTRLRAQQKGSVSSGGSRPARTHKPSGMGFAGFAALLSVFIPLFSEKCVAFSVSISLQSVRRSRPMSHSGDWTKVASSFFGDFDELGDEDEEEDDDDDDYDLDDLDVAKFRSRMSSMFGDTSSSDENTTSSSSTASSVDELISFARSKDPEATETNTDWAKPTDELEPGTVLLANPAKFCADFGTSRSTPSPSLLAKFGLTLPPPVELGPDRRADLLPVLMIVSKTNTGGFQAVLLNRRTGYLLGDLDNSNTSGRQSTPMLEKFCIQPLWFGGVDNISAGLDMLHQCPLVDGAEPLTEDGLFWGGDPNQAQEAMSDSRLERVLTGFDFKFYVQATIWSKGELEQHMDTKNWFCAKVSKEVLFKSRDRLGSKRGRPLWTEVMELMGSHDSHYKEIRDEFYANE